MRYGMLYAVLAIFAGYFMVLYGLGPISDSVNRYTAVGVLILGFMILGIYQIIQYWNERKYIKEQRRIRLQ